MTQLHLKNPRYPKRAIPVGGVLPRLKELRDVTTWGSKQKHHETTVVKLDSRKQTCSPDHWWVLEIHGNSRKTTHLYSLWRPGIHMYFVYIYIHMLWWVPGINYLAVCPTSWLEIPRKKMWIGYPGKIHPLKCNELIPKLMPYLKGGTFAKTSLLVSTVIFKEGEVIFTKLVRLHSTKPVRRYRYVLN